MIIKAEVVRHPGRDPKDNPRFVVTNLSQTPKWIYEKIYCQRGDAENRIKELQLGLEMDRTSCSSSWANQLRVLLTTAAFVLMQELRLRVARTACARARSRPSASACSKSVPRSFARSEGSSSTSQTRIPSSIHGDARH